MPLHPPKPLPAPIRILPSTSSPLLLPLNFSTRFLALPYATDVSTMACCTSSLGSHSPRRPTPADGGDLRRDRRLSHARPSLLPGPGPRTCPWPALGSALRCVSPRRHYDRSPAGSPGRRRDRCRAHALGDRRVPAGAAGGTWGNLRDERRPGDGARRLSFYDLWRPPPLALASLQATQALVAVSPFSSSRRRRPWLVLPMCPPTDGAHMCRWPCLGHTCGASGQSLFYLWLYGSGACRTPFLQQCALYTMRQRTLRTSIDAIAEAVTPRHRPRRPQPRSSSPTVTPRARPSRAGCG